MQTTLIPAQIVAAAAAPLPAVVAAASAVPLESPTPCADWDLATLVRHQLHWSPMLAAAARKEHLAPGPAEEDTDLDGWAGRLPAELTAVATAWTDEQAWAGEFAMAGPQPFPAVVLGGMSVAELVLHGWDLARAAGVEPQWEEPVLVAVHGVLTEITPMGREMGAFGPEVPVPAGASTLHRVLGLAGRDPSWTA